MAMIVCSGECTHGKSILWCGNSVLFTAGACHECAEMLRREGFEVSIGTPTPSRV